MVVWASLPVLALDNDSAPPALTEEERAIQEAKEGGQFPLGANITFSQAVGGGTFVGDPYTRRAAYDVSLGVEPYWRLTSLARVSVKAAVSHSLVENYDTIATYRNRTVLSDTSLNLKHLRMFVVPVLDIGVSGGLSAVFPTGPVSQYRGLIVSTAANVGLSRAVGPVYLSYGFKFYKNFNRYTTAIVDKAKVGEHVILAHYDGNEQLTTDIVSAGTNNVSYGILNVFLASWSITDEISLALYYDINNAWTFESFEKDENSSPYAQAGRGQRDVQRGVVDLSYQFNKHLSLSLGTETWVAPKTANTEAYVFPFMNFSRNNRADSQVYMSLAGVF